MIKTAEQWQRELKYLEVSPLEDVRDDVMSLVKNSGLSFKDIEGRNGPAASTLSKWAAKEVKNPQFKTLRATLNALGKDFYIGAGLPKLLK